MKMNLFEEFAKVPFETWVARVEKDLKGGKVDSLNWQLEQEVVLLPFYNAESVATTPLTLSGTTASATNRWDIGEVVRVGESKAANAEILDGLNCGVNAPKMVLPLGFDAAAQLQILLHGISCQYLSAGFEVAALHDARPLATELQRLFADQQLDTTDLNGRILSPLCSTDADFDALAALVRFSKNHLPKFRVVAIDGLALERGAANTTDELATLLAIGSEYCLQLINRDLDIHEFQNRFVVKVGIGKSYFTNIAKIRALKWMWTRMLDAYSAVTTPLPYLEATTSLDTESKDVYTNMIAATTQAMSAVIGGVNALVVTPADNFEGAEPTGFTRRIARNVQHLLAMESHLDFVLDPSHGSYYIETLTHALATSAWKKFQAIEAAGGWWATR